LDGKGREDRKGRKDEWGIAIKKKNPVDPPSQKSRGEASVKGPAEERV